MLQNIRSNLQGTIAKVIIGIICIPFVLFGVESLVSGGGSNTVAQVNGEDISAQELNEAVFLQKRQLMAQMAGNINPAMLEDERLKEPALQSLIDRKLMLLAADDMNMAVSTQLFNQTLTNNPQFQEDGTFSNARFQQVLAGAGFTAELFSRLYHADMLTGQLSSGIVDSGFITKAELGVNTRFTQQTRDVRFITLPIASLKKSLKASEEELNTFYGDNPDLFQSKEKLSVSYIEMRRADFVKPVSDEEVQLAYDNEVANLAISDERHIAHILIEINDKRSEEEALTLAADLTQQLDAGAEFSALAAKNSDDFGSRENGGKLGLLNVDAFPEAFVASASTLVQGQVSAPVKTEAGIHLIKLNTLTKAQLPSFEKRQAALKEELALAKADPLFWQAVDDLKDISFNAADLSEPAESLNLKIKASPFIERSGGKALFANRQFVAAAYSDAVLKDGQNSDVIELSNEHVMVVRLAEHKPAALLPLSDVLNDVKASVISDKANSLLVDSADALLTQLKQGGDVEKLAKSQGYDWQLMLAVRRNDPKANADRDVLRNAFKLPKAAVGQRALDSVKLSNGDYVVMAVDNVVDGDGSQLSDVEKLSLSAYLARSQSMSSFQAWQKNLKESATINRL